jgi:hypothetical protein
MPALADESPAASTSAEPVAATSPPAATSEAAPATPSARTDKATPKKGRRASADDAASNSETSQLKQVQLKTLNDRTVCRTEHPTGTRIGVKRCYSTTETETAAGRVQNEIMRHDIEEMRDRQVYEQLQRASIAMTPMGQASPGR